jgi:hypothetical protein
MINTEGKYKFPNFKDLEFTDPTITVDNKVMEVNPETMTIHVNAYIERDGGDIKGRYYIDINPVPVQNLNYDGGELLQRIIERLNDFKT